MKKAMLYTLFLSMVLPRLAYAESKEGERLANEVCTSCHIVKSGQAVQPVYNDALSKFEDIANKPGFSRSWFATFLSEKHASTSRPTGMPDLHLTPTEVEDLYAYILTLKKQ
jgi:hypothetical protein